MTGKPIGHKMRMVICGAFLIGMSVADIAKTLDLSRADVENAIRKWVKS